MFTDDLYWPFTETFKISDQSLNMYRIKSQQRSDWLAKQDVTVNPEAIEKQRIRLEAQQQKESECTWHESDWLTYASNPPQNKCKKCWAFYR